MYHSSRHHSSRTEDTYTSCLSRATGNDSADYPRPLATIREHQQRDRAASLLIPHGGSTAYAPKYPGGHHSHATSSKITMTKISIHTSSESSTSYHIHMEYTAYENYRSSSAYVANRRTERSSSSAIPNNEDGHYISDKSLRDSTRRPKDGSRMPEASSQHHTLEASHPRRMPEESSKPSLLNKSHRDSTRRPKDGSRMPEASSQHHTLEASYPRRMPAESSKPSLLKEPKSTYTDKTSTNHVSGQRTLESGTSRRRENAHSNRREVRRGEIASKAEEKFPDYYAALKIGPLASDEEIKSAAKRRRVEVHPDRLKTRGMSNSECAKIDAAAAMVGQAADVLQNPELKRKYDRNLFATKGWTWQER